MSLTPLIYRDHDTVIINYYSQSVYCYTVVLDNSEPLNSTFIIPIIKDGHIWSLFLARFMVMISQEANKRNIDVSVYVWSTANGFY